MPRAPAESPTAEEVQARESVSWETSFRLFVGMVALAIAAGVFVSIADPDPTWLTRRWDDPMVITHLVLAFPLAVALSKRMWITASLTYASLLMSTIYHVWFEHPNSRVLDVLDEVFAYALFVWVIRLVVDMLFFRGPQFGGMRWIVTGLITGLSSLVFFYLPGSDLPDDGRHNCYNEKLHPLWHVLGFFAIGAFTVAWKQHDVTGPMRPKWWQQA